MKVEPEFSEGREVFCRVAIGNNKTTAKTVKNEIRFNLLNEKKKPQIRRVAMLQENQSKSINISAKSK